ncbi:NAD(P)-dependent dehydrogenase (short-subunit alcohol dehydrogenase family) [Paenibacillus sp. V4I3]|uniref:SDR family oxidoreductase n=1 Tax=unclassified Paenibacillus TaxID=185978 RepID=UPI0027881E5B|nr:MULTISPECIES: SDR family oxidoreductase [unclassified Paenibacillus]MDQ0875878.1 NAD(P)-dependent dehydrogenase (short-subunit alcohol dehydrogenase family) [Paenibacillus sp. V4I3]MDQ0888059.1 NAD(P)-dependent dehydrogenase (short-subunit alcohol dehydrogenase family) [Paenibacillus sp. V4I9]
MRQVYGYIKKVEMIPIQFPPQQQPFQPGLEWMMVPLPVSEDPNYRGSGKLAGKTAIVSGGDSGIGKAVSIAFAKEGADLVIVYLNEHQDAENTKQRIEQLGRKCLAIAGDLGDESFSRFVVDKTLNTYGSIDILVNNCAEMHIQKSFEQINPQQLVRTFQTNIFSFFYLSQAVLPYLKPGSSIINTTSRVAYLGKSDSIDYAATKGAIVTFIRSLALNLVDRDIRVNGVAPGPVWTPLNVSAGYTVEEIMTFGYETPMKRASQPAELAPAYVYLASDDSRYVTGQMIHVNGGTITNS